MRKLKVIGLAALAVLAVSAVNASGASAAEGTVKVSVSPVVVTANQVGNHTFTLPNGRVLRCTTASFTAAVANGAKSVTVTPTYTGCTATVGASHLPVTVKMTSCDYKFYDLTTTAAHTYAAKTDVVCPNAASGEAIHITLYSNATTHSENKPLCEYTVDQDNNTGLAGVHFTDNTNDTLNIRATEVSVHLTRNTLIGTTGNCGEATTISKYNGDTLATPASGTLALDD